MRPPDSVGQTTLSDRDSSDSCPDCTRHTSGRTSTTARRSARLPPTTLVVPALVACALLTAIGSQSVALVVRASAEAVDPATFRALGVADPLSAVAASGSLAARVAGAVAGAGTAYTLARTGVWLALRA
ncbi:hypothetical protein [Halobaculum limi]|uniref:hypothetical protein n=1 Tax=Halobaculum limi TaxID=3031916 RepID=UPI002405C78E|nr:hypothetical protein [Halobaculum sp. YSMS11]